MNTSFESWFALLLATDAPALPSLSLLQNWLPLGWGVVLAWLCVGAMARWMPGTDRVEGRQFAAAVLVLLSMGLPGPYSPAYWLGLAFQAPSVVTVLWCARCLVERWVPSSAGQPPATGENRLQMWLAVVGVLVGWALLLDTFALLLLQLYAWGFSPAAVGLLAVAAVSPWLVSGGGPQPVRTHAWVAPLALLMFAAWRLPTGNVWDAVLDPWLWIALHVYLGRKVWVRNRPRGFPLIT